MSHALEVIAPGLHTTVQDLGRIGFQDVGVPRSGPLDAIAMRLANALAGNDAGAPCLEMLIQGPTLRVAAERVRVALVGCGAGIEVRGAEGRGVRRVPPGQSVTVEHGDTLRVGGLGECVCAYLAFEGGLDVPRILGSAATYVRGGFGGHHGRRLAAGDRLTLVCPAVEARPERALLHPFDPRLDDPVHVVLGPQTEYFTDAAVETFLATEYVVSPRCDRMGYRLEGAALAHRRGYDIVSDGIVTGAVQVPGSGQPIVLMVDNQTTGGYPKIATVASADVPLVARRKPGRRVRFVAVRVEEAERLRSEQAGTLGREIEAIAPV